MKMFGVCFSYDEALRKTGNCKKILNSMSTSPGAHALGHLETHEAMTIERNSKENFTSLKVGFRDLWNRVEAPPYAFLKTPNRWRSRGLTLGKKTPNF